jgi:hypothetical protein
VANVKGKKTKKTKSRTKPKKHSKAKAGVRTKKKTTNAGLIETLNPPTPIAAVSIKTCQEVEVGDIGGFGSTEELEEHEKRCSETATEFCTHCGKNLCRNHYDLMHRDHDTTGHATNPTTA